MCGRFTLTIPTYEELAEAFGVEPTAGFEAAYRPRYNVAPTDPMWIVREYHGIRELVSSEWGLVPRWSKTKKQAGRPINARSETLESRPVFRESFERRRCIVAADGFFEWDKTDAGRIPYWFRPAEGGLLRMAGIWDHWFDESLGRKVCTFSIVTTDASDDVVALHDRMPLILTIEEAETWLHVPGRDDPAIVPPEVEKLLRPSDPGTLTKTRVSTRVNSVKNDDATCLLPGDSEDKEPRAAKPAAKKHAKRKGAPAAETIPMFESVGPIPARHKRH
ncbi:MAG: SOS response-associated peptidase [Polyangiaceae bacterium]|nr:SOS response-associated peptidase [Polyangiaceae bacterium]